MRRANSRTFVHPYAERGSPKYEKAALRWLERYLTEGSLRLRRFAGITASPAKRESRPRELLRIEERELEAGSPNSQIANRRSCRSHERCTVSISESRSQ